MAVPSPLKAGASSGVLAALRELLPPPIPSADNAEVDGDLARAAQGRLHLMAHWQNLADECVTSPHQLYAHGDDDLNVQVSSIIQRVVLEWITSARR